MVELMFNLMLFTPAPPKPPCDGARRSSRLGSVTGPGLADWAL